ncbi:MAG: glycosyltransferase family 9 protein [Candidatus Electrothrix sp. AR3]|nr:glycosyltransferase family 9 protein [Candidatus Electrothrix sp. AR3]
MLEKQKRILIIKPSSLGDIIHTLPVVHALKRYFPGSSIGWVVQQSYAPLLVADKSIDTVYPISIPSTSDPHAGQDAWLQALKATVHTLKMLRAQFQQEPYDLILDLHASLRSGLLGRTNPGGKRIGFKDAKELNTFFQNELIAVPAEMKHAQDKNLLFCTHLQCQVREEDFYLCCGEEDNQKVKAFLARHGLNKKQVIYANPAARWQSKFWPVEHWAALADQFDAQGKSLVFGGSKQDVEYIDSIKKKMHTSPVIAAGHLSLPQSIALMQHASLYIGLDSGPMHMAALSRIPVVALFGPTHPERVGPYGVEHRIIRVEQLDCLECRKRKCSHCSCMQGISSQMVYDAALSLL